MLGPELRASGRKALDTKLNGPVLVRAQKIKLSLEMIGLRNLRRRHPCSSLAKNLATFCSYPEPAHIQRLRFKVKIKLIL